MTETYKIADKNIKIDSLFGFVHVYCKDYGTESEPDFTIEITDDDINAEKKKAQYKVCLGGWLEVFIAFRKIAEQMPKYDRFLIHGSAVAVDCEGYLFTAKSGTGKSTHTRLWRELFGSRAVMINDDKPIVGISEKGATIYGTPYDGKEQLSNNISVPLKAICLLERSERNEIHEISASEAYPIIVQQTYHPLNPEMLNRTLELLDRMSRLVRFYRLSCNMEREAAEISYSEMRGLNRNMRLKNEFLTHVNGDEAYIVPSGGVDFRGLIKGNQTLGEVVELLKSDTTEAKIVKFLRKKYNAPNGTIEFDVRKALDVLRSVGAIIE